MTASLDDSRGHLADLVEACQRCAWHLDATAARIEWPLTPATLEQRQMDLGLFEPLAAYHRRHEWRKIYFTSQPNN
jgi:hypothetical protein